MVNKDILINRVKRYVFIMISGVCVGIFAPFFLNQVVSLGYRISQDNMQLDYFTAVIWTIVLSLGIFILPISTRNKKGLFLIWLAKIFMVLGFMLFYESHYPLDSFGYFEASRHWGFRWGLISGGTLNITKVVWLHHQLPFIGDSYHATKASFAMIGLASVYLFYRSAVMFLRREDIRILYILGLFPSILFWTSTLGKEPIIIFGIALYTYGVVAIYCLKKLRYLFILAMGIMLCMFIRLWLGPILVLPLVIFAFKGIRGGIRKAVFFLIIIVVTLSFGSRVKERLHFNTMEKFLERANAISRNFSAGGSGQQEIVHFSDAKDIVFFIPKGIFTALFRPFLWEAKNPFSLLAGLENLFLLILLIFAMKRTSLKEVNEPLIIWSIALILIWATVYGFVSFNLGTAFRYKSQVCPILLMLLLYLGRKRVKDNSFVSKGI